MTVVPILPTPLGRGARGSGRRGCGSTVLPRPRRIRAFGSARFGPSRIPWITLGLLAAALVASLPTIAPWVEGTTGAIAGGEPWRLVTGHFTHWSFAHFVWDWMAFGALGAALEGSGRRRFAALLATSALAIPLGLAVLDPGLAHYRGLSGLCSALFGLAWIGALERSLGDGQSARSLALGALGAGFGAKLVWELSIGSAFFMPAGSTFEPVPIAHAIGAALGVAAGLARTRRPTLRESIA